MRFRRLFELTCTVAMILNFDTHLGALAQGTNSHASPQEPMQIARSIHLTKCTYFISSFNQKSGITVDAANLLISALAMLEINDISEVSLSFSADVDNDLLTKAIAAFLSDRRPGLRVNFITDADFPLHGVGVFLNVCSRDPASIHLPPDQISPNRAIYEVGEFTLSIPLVFQAKSIQDDTPLAANRATRVTLLLQSDAGGLPTPVSCSDENGERCMAIYLDNIKALDAGAVLKRQGLDITRMTFQYLEDGSSVSQTSVSTFNIVVKGSANAASYVGVCIDVLLHTSGDWFDILQGRKDRSAATCILTITSKSLPLVTTNVVSAGRLRLVAVALLELLRSGKVVSVL